VQELLSGWALHPEYDLPTLAWLLDEVARKRDIGPLETRLVRDGHGQAIGWFTYFANRGGIGEVVQLVARPGDQGRILAPLVADARARGVVALTGRMEPQAVAPLVTWGARFSHAGPWCLTHARDPRLLTAMLRGAGYISRLEGEWWLNF
jgi:hypothetical protein